MSEPRFSEGPWALSVWRNAVTGYVMSACIVQPDGGVVASFDDWEETEEDDVVLMAASKELYDAGMNIVRYWESGNPISDEAMSMLIAALKKARDEA